MIRYRILLTALLALVMAAGAEAANTKIYTEQGGAKRIYESSAELEMQSGATLDVQSGATVVLQGLTFSSTELGALDGITLGNSQNSKVWTANSTGKLILVSGDSIDIAAGSVWQISSVTVTSSAAEINALDRTTTGATENGKAWILRSTGGTTLASGDSLIFASGSLWVINATTVTASGTELNYTDVTTLGSSENSKADTRDANGLLTVVSGDATTYASGSTLTVASGATMSVFGSNNTATGTELTYNDVTTLGTSENGKTATYSATGKHIVASGDTVDFNTGVLAIAGTKVTSSAAELNYLDVTTLGSSEDSKAITVAATGEATIVSGDSLTVASGGVLNHASGATLNLHGSAWTSTEFGFVDGITAGTFSDSKAVVLGASGTVAGGRLELVVTDTVGIVNLNAGKTILADMAGVTVTITGVEWELVADSIETATSVILADQGGSPVTIHTISGDALLCASGITVTSSADRGATTQAYGAGWGVALTAGKGLKVTCAGGTAASDTGYLRVRVRYTVDQ